MFSAAHERHIRAVKRGGHWLLAVLVDRFGLYRQENDAFPLQISLLFREIIIIIISGSTVLARNLAAPHRRFRNLFMTLSRTPLDELSARRKGDYLDITTQHRNTKTNMLIAGFEPTTPVTKRPRPTSYWILEQVVHAVATVLWRIKPTGKKFAVLMNLISLVLCSFESGLIMLLSRSNHLTNLWADSVSEHLFYFSWLQSLVDCTFHWGNFVLLSMSSLIKNYGHGRRRDAYE
jgi:hypothetical protein